MTPAIQVAGLTKFYGELLAVDHIHFEVPEGEIFGFLGPNGAGKTTTVRMLTGLTKPSAGNARILGYDLGREITRIKKVVGLAPETSNLYDELSAKDNLIFMAQLYGVPRQERGERADVLLRRFRLWEKRAVPFAKLSRGMKRALTVAAALIHRPRLLFLDEPTTGLDVLNARALRALIRQLRDEGVTIFLTTHYLEEAERLCDRLAFIVKGHIVALDTVENLKANAQSQIAVEMVVGPGPRGDGNGHLRFAASDVKTALKLALEEAERQNRPVLAVRTVQPSLEEVFIQLTGLEAEVMLAEKGGK
ncbi:MAG: ABC transporter ATP-binding protein [Anaerolineae bacterium]